MTLAQAVILGIVQGITEFVPVSSSGHLLLMPYLFGWDVQSLAFDAALHLGTLAAVLVCFRERLQEIVRDRHYLLLLLVGTLPAVVAGFLFSDVIETVFRSPVPVAVNLVVFGIVMLVAEQQSPQEKTERELTMKDALVIGLAQVLALVPGVSRSGITIAAGLFRSLRTADAAIFSFLLGIPVIAGAGTLSVWELASGGGLVRSDVLSLGVGTVTAAVVGIIVIRVFLRFVQTRTLKIFVAYRVVLALLIFLLLQ